MQALNNVFISYDMHLADHESLAILQCIDGNFLKSSINIDVASNHGHLEKIIKETTDYC